MSGDVVVMDFGKIWLVKNSGQEVKVCLFHLPR